MWTPHQQICAHIPAINCTALRFQALESWWPCVALILFYTCRAKLATALVRVKQIGSYSCSQSAELMMAYAPKPSISSGATRFQPAKGIHYSSRPRKLSPEFVASTKPVNRARQLRTTRTTPHCSAKSPESPESQPERSLLHDLTQVSGRLSLQLVPATAFVMTPKVLPVGILCNTVHRVFACRKRCWILRPRL